MKVNWPKLVGIVNVTPDSFSDGGKYFDLNAAKAQIDKLIKDGADIIDLGAESTRPGANDLIDHREEWQRLAGVLSYACSKEILISVDTRNFQTADKSISMGANWINDVSGLNDELMLKVVRPSNVKVVLMHSLTVPANPLVNLPEKCDPVSELYKWAESNISRLESKGIARKRIIFDPGVGFGKTKIQSLEIVNRVKEFLPLDVEIMVGHSRKSFMALLGANTLEEKDQVTLDLSRKMALSGVNYLRVHNILKHKK